MKTPDGKALQKAGSYVWTFISTEDKMLEIHSWHLFFKQPDKVQTAHINLHIEGKMENTEGRQTEFQSPPQTISF